MRRLPSTTLSLAEFIHRSKVLQQYRSFLRELRGVDVAAAAELRDQIRASFKKHKDERNRAQRAQLLSEGARQLIFVRTYVGTARKAQQAAGVEGMPGTWVGSGDVHDVRGRIGEGWPWGGKNVPGQASSLLPTRLGVVHHAADADAPAFPAFVRIPSKTQR